MLRNINYKKEFLFIFLLLVIFLFILIYRLWFLQVVKYEEITSKLEKQNFRTIRIPPIRGRIFSANKEILADSLPVYSIEVFINELRKGRQSSFERNFSFLKNVLAELSEISPLVKPFQDKTLEGIIKNRSKNRYLLMKNAKVDLRGIMGRYPFIVEEKAKIFLDMKLYKYLPKQSGFNHTISYVAHRINALNKKIGRKREDFSKKLKNHLVKYRSLPFQAIKNLTREELLLASENLYNYKGFNLNISYKRDYPQLTKASHILGSVGKKRINYSELSKQYSFFLPELAGTRGLEYYYDEILRGEGGLKTIQVDIAGFSDKKSEKRGFFLDKAVKNGKDLLLNLDLQAQKKASELLEGKRGAIVCVDIHTGAIKVMASSPNYDIKKIREKQYYQDIVKKKAYTSWVFQELALTNKSLQAYIPGSIIKPFLALAYLEKKGLNDGRKVSCLGYYKFSGGEKTIRCRYHSNPLINIADAIEQSCNTFFIKLGIELGIDYIKDFFFPFRIGDKYFSARGKRFSYEQAGIPPGYGRWIFSETAYFSIGQGKIKLTPLQAAMMTASLANGGILYQPQFVKAMIDGGKEFFLEPKIISRFSWKKANLDLVRNAMRKVLSGSRGTARSHNSSKIAIAGKTGTAEVAYLSYEKDGEGKVLLNNKGDPLRKKKIFKNAWFIGFAPYDKPKYAVAVLILGGKSGGTSAAPIAKKFFEKIFDK